MPRKIIVRIVSWAAVILAVILILHSVSRLTFRSGMFKNNEAPQSSATDRNYHVVILGKSANTSFLSQVYKGAEDVSGDYNAVVELYVPDTQADDDSLESLLNYAMFVNADGIIAYVDSDTEGMQKRLYRIDGGEIPVITLGHYNAEMPQVSFIGVNYSELGHIFGSECISIMGGSGEVFVYSSETDSNPNYSNFMNSLKNSLAGFGTMNLSVINSETDITTVLSNRIVMQGNDVVYPLLVCLSDDDTIRCAHLLSEKKIESSVRMIGMGSAEPLPHYLDIGIIDVLVYVDPVQIGRTAMKELFEYRNFGYANSYIAADVEIKRREL